MPWGYIFRPMYANVQRAPEAGRIISTAAIGLDGRRGEAGSVQRYATAAIDGGVRKETTMWTRVVVMTVTAGVAATMLGCGQTPSTPAAVIEDKVYTVTPPALAVKAGVTDMKITERIDKGSGNVVSPAKLTGRLKLQNSSTDQTIRLIGGKIQFIDADGKPILVEEKKFEPAIKFQTYGAAERLDPGQDAAQNLDLDFPAVALKAKKLKEIRLELTYIPSPYKADTVNFPVSIGGQ
jgi:hypothetical protein